MPDNNGGPIRPDDPLQRAQETIRRLWGSPAQVIFLGATQYAAAIAFAKAADTDDGAADGWTPIGPRNVGGAVRTLAQDPTPANAHIWYAGSAGGGLWRSTDDGNTWDPLGEADIGVVPIGAV